jgi:hypothetical protein
MCSVSCSTRALRRAICTVVLPTSLPCCAKLATLLRSMFSLFLKEALQQQQQHQGTWSKQVLRKGHARLQEINTATALQLHGALQSACVEIGAVTYLLGLAQAPISRSCCLIAQPCTQLQISSALFTGATTAMAAAAVAAVLRTCKDYFDAVMQHHIRVLATLLLRREMCSNA